MAVLLGHGRGGELDQGDAEYPPPGQKEPDTVFQMLYVLHAQEVLPQFYSNLLYTTCKTSWTDSE